MVLAHHRRQPPFEPAQQIAEPAVAVASWMGFPVFLPQNHHGHAGTFQLARQLRPIRLGAPPLVRRSAGPAKQLALESVIGGVVRQRPFQFSRRRPFQTVLDRAARYPQKAPDLARAHSIVVKSQ